MFKLMYANFCREKLENNLKMVFRNILARMTTFKMCDYTVCDVETGKARIKIIYLHQTTHFSMKVKTWHT